MNKSAEETEIFTAAIYCKCSSHYSLLQQLFTAHSQQPCSVSFKNALQNFGA